MYKIGIKYRGVVIASVELSEEEDIDMTLGDNRTAQSQEFYNKGIQYFGEKNYTFILALFQNKFGLNIGQYGLSEYENIIGSFFIHIRSEDLERLRNDKLEKLGI